jgi:2'-5' RNA ligase
MPRPNWFFAFPLDGSFVGQLPPLPPSFRLFHPDDVHLTLSFLGGCGEPAALCALEALDQMLAAARPAPVRVSLGPVVPMGSRPYSALSALLEVGRAEAVQLIASLRDGLSDAALGRREKRPPKPHVTVARPSRGASAPALAAGLAWATALNLHGIEARLDRIALYTWSEGARRPRLFRVVAERALVAS